MVITGDYIDDYTKYEDMVDTSKELGKLKIKYGIYYILGNHNKGYFNNKNYNYNSLQKELNKNNVIVLEDELFYITDNIVLIGRLDKSDVNRENIIDLTKKIDKSKYIVTLGH